MIRPDCTYIIYYIPDTNKVVIEQVGYRLEFRLNVQIRVTRLYTGSIILISEISYDQRLLHSNQMVYPKEQRLNRKYSESFPIVCYIIQNFCQIIHNVYNLYLSLLDTVEKASQNCWKLFYFREEQSWQLKFCNVFNFHNFYIIYYIHFKK